MRTITKCARFQYFFLSFLRNWSLYRRHSYSGILRRSVIAYIHLCNFQWLNSLHFATLRTPCMNKLCRHMVIGYTHVQTATLLLFFRLPMLICSFVAQVVHTRPPMSVRYLVSCLCAAENVTTVYAIEILVRCGHRFL